MKKIILGLFLIVLIAVAGGVYYVLTNLDSLVKQAIETHGSKATQTAVLVDNVNIDLANGAAGLKGLTIANPSGYEMPNAFSLGEIRTGINLQSLQEEPYIIDEITVLAPQVFVEIDEENRTNLNELKKNLSAASSSSTSQKKETESGAAEPKLIIRRLTFADGTIQAKAAVLQDKELKVKLPRLDMSNLGGSEGATAAELANEILTRLTDRAIEVVKKDIIDAELEKLKAEAKAKLDAEKARLKEKADARLKEEEDKVTEKATESLKELFSK